MQNAVPGTISTFIDGNLLVVEGLGPWNEDALNRSTYQFLPLTKKLYGTDWGVLIILHGEPIHTPEAAKLLKEFVIKDKMNGRVASAIVLDNQDYQSFGELHLGGIYKAAGETSQFFDTKEEAKAWLSIVIPIKHDVPADKSTTKTTFRSFLKRIFNR